MKFLGDLQLTKVQCFPTIFCLNGVPFRIPLFDISDILIYDLFLGRGLGYDSVAVLVGWKLLLITSCLHQNMLFLTYFSWMIDF